MGAQARKSFITTGYERFTGVCIFFECVAVFDKFKRLTLYFES